MATRGARATEVGQAGELNIGQLARERHPGDARLIAERKNVWPGLPGSYEALFHCVGMPSFPQAPETFPFGV